MKLDVAHSLVVAALIMAASASLAWAAPEHISAELAQRLFGVMLSVVVVVYANAAPKALVPLARLRCDAATEQSLRRYTGRSIVLGGIGFGLAWVFAPIEFAGLLAAALLATAFVAVVVRWGRAASAGGAA
jgi:hypothetical protein